MMTNNITTSSKKYVEWIILALIALAFFIHNMLSAEFHDDFIYKFVFGFPDYSKRVGSLTDIIYSQYNHYFSTNGRTIVHVFVQLFTGILGKPFFNIINTLVFIAFIHLLKHNLSKHNCYDIFAYSVTVALVLMMPEYNQTFLWMCGSINYLWTAVGALIFLLIYDKQCQESINSFTALYCILVFLLGWTHEAISFPLAVSVFAFNCFRIKSNYKTNGFWIAMAYLIGSCMAALAPSTTARADVTDGLSLSDLAMKLFSGFIILGKLRIVFITLLLIIILWYKQRSIVKELISDNAYLLLAAVPALGIIFISGFDAARTAFGLELFCLIFLLRMIGRVVINYPQHLNRIGITVFAGLAVFYGFVIYHAIPTWQETKHLIAQIQENRDCIIATNEHDAGIFSPMIRTMIDKDDSPYAKYYDAHDGWPTVIAAVYHRDSLIFLPQAFLAEIRFNPNRFEEFDMDSPYEFFAKKIGNEQIDSIIWQLNPTDFSTIPFFYRPIAKRLGRYVDDDRECDNWAIVNLYGQRYLIVKKEHAWDKRRKGIRVIEKESAEATDDKNQKAA